GAYLFQSLEDGLFALAQLAAIEFDLFLTRATAGTDTALLPFQVGPAAHQARHRVLDLRQLDLQLAFVGTSALGKDIKDQANAVNHPALQGLFKVALLPGR